MPDGTPKHVDLGNKRLLSRANHADMNGPNITDIDNVIDSTIPLNSSIRVDRTGDFIMIPKKEIERLRFKQLSPKEHDGMLQLIRNIRKTLLVGKSLVKDLMIHTIEKD